MADKAGSKETIIGPETRISGEVRGDEDLVVRGRIDGKVQLSQALAVEPAGIVQADVDVRSVVISGVLLGSVVASESIRLTEKARVIGNLSAPRVIIEAGAAYRGRVEMGESAASPRAAQRRQTSDRPAASSPPIAVAVGATSIKPPRLAPPRPGAVAAPSVAAPRVTGSTNGPAIRASSPTVQRVVSAPVPRSAVPPSLPRPASESLSAGAASGGGWAKKKLKRKA